MSTLGPRTVSHDWIMKNVFGFSEKEIKAITRVLDEVSMPWGRPDFPSIAELQLEKAIQNHDRESHPS